MGFALGFAAQNCACAAEFLERKRAEMAALHHATIGVMRAGKVKPLLVRAERARQRWSGLLVDEELHALDDLVERVLKARLQAREIIPEIGSKERRGERGVFEQKQSHPNLRLPRNWKHWGWSLTSLGECCFPFVNPWSFLNK